MSAQIREKLNNNDCTFGTWQMVGNDSISEILCQSGFEWVVIDLEHTGISISEALRLIRTIDLSGKVPAVRVCDNDPVLIKRVLDSGARIIIVPMIMDAKDAINAVNSIYYPPRGKRGVGLSRAQGYGFEFEDYCKKIDEEVLFVAQIEHISAINHLEEILEVDGIDATIIGPYDLSGSLETPGNFETEEFKNAILKYENVSKEKGIPMGFHLTKPTKQSISEYVKRGYQFIALGFDTFFLGAECRKIVKTVKESMEELK